MKRPTTGPAILQLAWWGKFCAEIEAIGGKVGNAFSSDDIDLQIPEDKIDQAKEIMRRYWDAAAKCARDACYNPPNAECIHSQTGLVYCVACVRKINDAAKTIGHVGNLVAWPKKQGEA